MEQYNRSVARVGKIERAGRTVAFTDSKGNWVFPVPFDFALWTKDIQARVQRAMKDRDPRRPVIIYTTGNISNAVAAQCARDNVRVMKTSLNGG